MIPIDRKSFKSDLKTIEGVSKNWGWFLVFGIILILLGVSIISTTFYSTIFSVFLFGLFLFAAGIVQIIQSFFTPKWSGLFLSLLLGILYLITGFLCATQPVRAAIGLTLWIAAFCLVVGLFRMATAVVLRFSQWGWVFFNGLITFILGILIYADWPVSGLWVIGLFIGIDLILSGWTWVILSLTAHTAGREEPL